MSKDPVLATVGGLIAQNSDTDQREDEYRGQDGLLYCKTCNGKRQTVIAVPWMGVHNKVVRCACSCHGAKIKEEQRLADNEIRRRACFSGTNMAGCTFEADDGKRPDLSAQAQRYADQFADFLREGKGLLFYGPVGTGKTYLAAAIANRVIDKGYTARMTNFAEIANQLFDADDKQGYMDGLCEYDLLVLDDLGAERKSEYMQEQVFNVIDARSRSGRPVIVTSNLTQQELTQTKETGHQRIYDRVLELCLPVKVDGESRRRQAARTEWDAMRKQLGMEART